MEPITPISETYNPQDNQNNFSSTSKRKLMIALGVILTLILIIILGVTAIYQNTLTKKSVGISPTPQLSSEPTSMQTLSPSLAEQQLHVTSTSPENGQQNVSAGEITITINTNNPILDEKSFSLEITPALPFYWKFENAYPTKTIQAHVFGGLKTSTQYTLTMKDQTGNPIYTWSFITSATPAESSSNLIQDQEQQQADKYYPLLKYVPYSNQDFDIDYTGHLTLSVVIKNQNVDAVKQEVLNWIKSNGVDPATHTINYTYPGQQ